MREPNHHIRPQPNADATDLSKFNEHADILLLKHDRRIYIDVTVTRPTNASNSALAGITSVPLLSTQARASAKHSKYAAISRENDYEFVAFVLESYGGLNDEAHDLLATLASHAVEEDQSSFLQFAHQCISVSLQRSNAFIAQVGTQMLHTEEQRLGGLADSRSRQDRRGRNSRRKQQQQQQQQRRHRASLHSFPRRSQVTRMTRQRQQQQLAGKRRQFSQRGLLPPSSSRQNVAQDALQLLLRLHLCSISSVTIRCCLRRRPSLSPLPLARERACMSPPRRLHRHRTFIPAVSLSSRPLSFLTLAALPICPPHMRCLARRTREEEGMKM